MTKTSPADPVDLTVVVPFLNEEASLAELHERLERVLNATERSHEIIWVDDGSTDEGLARLKALGGPEELRRYISFTRNFGKAAALSAGLAAARGRTIITMDADLQDDPDEIPRFLEQIDARYDVVSGWKQNRDDPIDKTIPSRFFNAMTSRMFGLDLHDINCGFKAYSRRAADALNLYGELHRFTPALLHAQGFKVTELPVRHQARKHGHSKYGSKRMIKGFLDMVTVKMMTSYGARPLHFFAMIGLPLLLVGTLAVAYLCILWLFGLGPIGDRPLLLIGVLLIVTGTQFLGTGLVAELVQSSGMSERKKYVINTSDIGRGEPD
ncbi:glycosyltransferase family 2 protein [Oceanomicrobium pacificus]|uniref:Glycosyltransferase n=1 Tax=Oceanomicrobium pacificus TaxID=2692916 RepID=A0A6B0TVF9_9RHOB|nr:glycosyltransferase family 2 protein [Oceanomicrobium pacificus]MXU65134.1 glycosyltransferase [Oceanomicrobium pacificus]